MRGGYCKKYIRRKMGYVNMWKIRDLKKLNKKVGEFISVTAKKDNSVKEQIEKAKEEFYTKYSYLKPECEKMDWKKCVMD